MSKYFLLTLLSMAVQSQLQNFGCSFTSLVTDVYFNGGLNSAQTVEYHADAYKDFPKFSFFVILKPDKLEDSFEKGFVFKYSQLFNIVVVGKDGSLKLGFQAAGTEQVNAFATSVEEKTIVLLVSVDIDESKTNKTKVNLYLGDASEVAQGNHYVTFKVIRELLPESSYDSFYNKAGAYGQKTSKLFIGSKDNACAGPPCQIGDFRGAIFELHMIPFTLDRELEFTLDLSRQPVRTGQTRLTYDYLLPLFLTQLDLNFTCLLPPPQSDDPFN